MANSPIDHRIVTIAPCLHDLNNDPDQLFNIAALPVGWQSETHRNAFAKLRTRCDALIAQNRRAMEDLQMKSETKQRRSSRQNAKAN